MTRQVATAPDAAATASRTAMPVKVPPVSPDAAWRGAWAARYPGEAGGHRTRCGRVANGAGSGPAASTRAGGAGGALPGHAAPTAHLDRPVDWDAEFTANPADLEAVAGAAAANGTVHGAAQRG
ncbi:hypothetical protein [Streptomyces sp. IBSBF 2435]|uniref:hypothetical protein n=1 Tax=Streptomyces sp. IBSBF 2435 TaxID=2903531 RepID=UPI002FDC3723